MIRGTLVCPVIQLCQLKANLRNREPAILSLTVVRLLISRRVGILFVGGRPGSVGEIHHSLDLSLALLSAQVHLFQHLTPLFHAQCPFVRVFRDVLVRLIRTLEITLGSKC